MSRLKLVVLFVLCGLVWDAWAAEVMDRTVQCNRIAIGAGGRVQGMAGHTEWVTGEVLVKYNKEKYKGSMYLLDEGETPEERAAFEEPLVFGWKMEDAYMAKHDGKTKAPTEILEECMKQQDSNGYGGQIRYVSQSENLGDPSVARTLECDFMAEVLVRAAQFKSGPVKRELAGLEVTAFLEKHPFPESYSKEFQTWARTEITGLFGFVGNSSEYIRQRHVACVHAT